MIRAAMSRERIDRHYDYAAPHLRPILTAVRDFDVGLIFVPQVAEKFRLPRNGVQPLVVLIGDDLDRAVGPEGFHMPSIRRAVRACCHFTVVTASPHPTVYGAAITPTVIGRRHSMLIETRIEHEFAWVEVIQKLAPDKPLVISSVKGGHA